MRRATPPCVVGAGVELFGVDDIGATYHNEKIVHAAGAQTPEYGSESYLKRLIEAAQLKPVRTTASYRTKRSVE